MNNVEISKGSIHSLRICIHVVLSSIHLELVEKELQACRIVLTSCLSLMGVRTVRVSIKRLKKILALVIRVFCSRLQENS